MATTLTLELQRALTFLTVGVATEGGRTPYVLTVSAGPRPGQATASIEWNGGNIWQGWPNAASGYSLGVMQVDLGAWDRPTLAVAFADQVRGWARSNGLTVSDFPEALGTMLQYRGLNAANSNEPTLRDLGSWIAKSDRDVINKYLATDTGKVWVYQNLETVAIKSALDKVAGALGTSYFGNLSANDQQRVLVMLLKEANQAGNVKEATAWLRATAASGATADAYFAARQASTTLNAYARDALLKAESAAQLAIAVQASPVLGPMWQAALSKAMDPISMRSDPELLALRAVFGGGGTAAQVNALNQRLALGDQPSTAGVLIGSAAQGFVLVNPQGQLIVTTTGVPALTANGPGLPVPAWQRAEDGAWTSFTNGVSRGSRWLIRPSPNGRRWFLAQEDDADPEGGLLLAEGLAPTIHVNGYDVEVATGIAYYFGEGQLSGQLLAQTNTSNSSRVDVVAGLDKGAYFLNESGPLDSATVSAVFKAAFQEGDGATLALNDRWTVNDGKGVQVVVSKQATTVATDGGPVAAVQVQSTRIEGAVVVEMATRLEWSSPSAGSHIERSVSSFNHVSGALIGREQIDQQFTFGGALLLKEVAHTYSATGLTETRTTALNSDGTSTSTYRDAAGALTRTETTQRFDDGSSITTASTPAGAELTVTRDSDANIAQTVLREPAIDGYTDTVRNATGELIETRHFTQTTAGSTLTIIYADGAERRIATDSNGVQKIVDIPSHAQTLATAASDLAALINAIRSGKPLPQLASGLRLLNTLTRNEIPGLPQTTAIAAAALSVFNFLQAAEGDDAFTIFSTAVNALASVNAALQTVGAGSQEIAKFFAQGGDGAAILPGLAIINALRNEDPVGFAMGIGHLAEALGMLEAGVSFAGTPFGWFLIALSVVQAMEEPEEAWGVAHAIFDDGKPPVYDEQGVLISAPKLASQDGSIVVELQGHQLATNRLGFILGGEHGLLNYLGLAVATWNSAHPNEPFGIVPQRLAILHWRAGGNAQPGFMLDDKDPYTGAPRLPDIRYDDYGNPINANTGVAQTGQTLIERMFYSAIERGALAPRWEVETARLQTLANSPNAGLNDVERARGLGLLAERGADGKPINASFTPIAMDMNGDGLIAVQDKAQSGRFFNWDDSGFNKAVGWVAPTEGLLVLDRNPNGQADGGFELFSNARVAQAGRGVRSLAWVDANGDGLLNAADPVFNELRVWRDANGSAVVDAGEAPKLAELGITEIDYSNNRFTRNGQLYSMQSPVLEAAAIGSNVAVIPQGILVSFSDGRALLNVSRVNDATNYPGASAIAPAMAVEGSPLDFVVSLSAPSAGVTEIELVPVFNGLVSANQTTGQDVVLPVLVSFDDGFTFTALTSSLNASGEAIYLAKVPAGKTQFVVRLDTRDDSVIEAVETLELRAQTPANLLPAAAVGTIIDNDVDQPLISISGPVTVTEGVDSELKYSVSLSRAGTSAITVKWSAQSIGAVAGEDFLAVPPDTLTFKPGELVKQVTVALTNDTRLESDETFRVLLHDAVGARIGVPFVSTSIHSEDVAVAELAVRQVYGDTANENQSGVRFFVQLTGMVTSSAGLSVNLALMNGTAIQGLDFLDMHVTFEGALDGPAALTGGFLTPDAQGNVLLPRGVTTFAVDVDLLRDHLTEGDETFSLAARTVHNTVAKSAVATVLDAPWQEALTITADKTRVVEGGRVYFTATLSAPLDHDVSFRVAGNTGLALADPFDLDYSHFYVVPGSNGLSIRGSGTFVDVPIPAGQTEARFGFRIYDDGRPEGEEQIVWSGTGGYGFGFYATPRSPVVTIVDGVSRLPPDAPSISIRAVEPVVVSTHGDDFVVFNLTRTGPTTYASGPIFYTLTGALGLIGLKPWTNFGDPPETFYELSFAEGESAKSFSHKLYENIAHGGVVSMKLIGDTGGGEYSYRFDPNPSASVMILGHGDLASSGWAPTDDALPQSLLEDLPAQINTGDLLRNDFHNGLAGLGNGLVVTAVRPGGVAGAASVELNSGAITFTPAKDFNGVSGFYYTVRAPDGSTKEAKVTVMVEPLPDAPQITLTPNVRDVYGWATLISSAWVEHGTGEASSSIFEATLTANQGQTFNAPFKTQAGRVVERDTDSGAWLPTGDVIDTGIAETVEFDEADLVMQLGGLNFRLAADLPLYLHDTKQGTETDNAGVLSVTDIDQPNAVWSITGAELNNPLLGKITINAGLGFDYVGSRFIEQRDTGLPLGVNVLTDRHMRGEETSLVDVSFTLQSSDGRTQTVTRQVVHFGPVPIPAVAMGGSAKPIAIDLNGDGFHFTQVDDSNVFFDVNADGWRRRVAWNNPADGFIAYDKNSDGKITDIDELSFIPYKPDGQTDLAGLAAFDSNHDGVFSATDEKWAKFGVWRDANRNGLTDAGELQGLSALGIARIELVSDGHFEVIDGQTVHGIARAIKTDGSVLALADVSLQYRNATITHDANGKPVVTGLPAFAATQTPDGTAANDAVLGGNGSDGFFTGAGNDVIMDSGGNDAVQAGAGDDVVYTGLGNDIVIAGPGDDKVFAGAGDDLVLGGDGHDFIVLEGGDDIALGGAGNDMILGGPGSDAITGDAGDDRLFGEGGWDALFGKAGNDELFGMDGNDLLYGDAGNDTLDGGAGDDTMEGGTGDDSYGVDSAGDVLIEAANAGTDTVSTELSTTLAVNFENLSLRGDAALSGTGNAAANVLLGNAGANRLLGLAGNDTLDGQAGADEMLGGTGDDRYGVDNALDRATELADEGTDTVLSRIDHTLGANIENLELAGIGAINGTGNSLANVLLGNAAANVLDGASGADQMRGGLGNDRYRVDNAGDVVAELVGEGYDTVVTSGLASYTLPANVEALELGQAGLTGEGNGQDNLITGNAGDNRLYGQAGADVLDASAGNDLLDGGPGDDLMLGGVGDDRYLVNSAGDRVVETADQGTDTVAVSGASTYTLADHLENLEMGLGVISGTGNALTNNIIGSADNNSLFGLAGRDFLQGGLGDDRLDGGEGDDALMGGVGNDVYVIDSALDQLFEQAAQGTDRVESTVDFTLGANLEDLTLLGTALRGTGNELANTLRGNDLANTLDGGAGNDTLVGGLGNDVLNGGAGNDTFLLTTEVANDGLDQYDGGTGVNTILGGWSYDIVLVQSGLSNLKNIQVLDGGDANLLYNTVLGTAGADVLNFSAMTVRFFTLDGGAGNDTITGTAGDDAIRGGLGNDVLSGGAGNDTFHLITQGVDNGLDQYDGGTGTNTIVGGWSADTLLVQSGLTNLKNIQVLDGGDLTRGINTVLGTSGNDTLKFSAYTVRYFVLDGAAGNDLITGTAGHDAMRGGFGNDTLTGGLGNDTLDGGAGSDSINGDAGDDNILLASRSMGDNDVITDSAGFDRVFFGAGITLAGIRVATVAPTGSFKLILDTGTGTGGITVAKDSAGKSVIEEFVFADGSVAEWRATGLVQTKAAGSVVPMQTVAATDAPGASTAAATGPDFVDAWTAMEADLALGLSPLQSPLGWDAPDDALQADLPAGWALLAAPNVRLRSVTAVQSQ